MGPGPARGADSIDDIDLLRRGHVAPVHAMAVKLGLPALLGPAGPQRDLAMTLIISSSAAANRTGSRRARSVTVSPPPWLCLVPPADRTPGPPSPVPSIQN